MGKPLKVIFYGPPGSGKDTHSHLLAKELGPPVFSIGGMMREAIAQKTDIGLQIEEYVSRGEIAPIAISLQLLREGLSTEEYKKGYVACGFKTLEFAKLYILEDVPTHVVHLTLDDALLRDRLRLRARFDDHPEAIEKRLPFIMVIRNRCVRFGVISRQFDTVSFRLRVRLRKFQGGFSILLSNSI